LETLEVTKATGSQRRNEENGDERSFFLFKTVFGVKDRLRIEDWGLRIFRLTIDDREGRFWIVGVSRPPALDAATQSSIVNLNRQSSIAQSAIRNPQWFSVR